MLKWATELPTGFANFWNVGDRLARPVQFQHACNLGRVASRPGYPVEPAARSRPCGRVPAGSRVERNALTPPAGTRSYQPGPPRSLTYKRSGQSDLSSYIISLITRSLHSRISDQIVGVIRGRLGRTSVIVALFRRIVIGNTECFQRVFVVQFMILPG